MSDKREKKERVFSIEGLPHEAKKFVNIYRAALVLGITERILRYNLKNQPVKNVEGLDMYRMINNRRYVSVLYCVQLYALLLVKKSRVIPLIPAEERGQWASAWIENLVDDVISNKKEHKQPIYIDPAPVDQKINNLSGVEITYEARVLEVNLHGLIKALVSQALGKVKKEYTDSGKIKLNRSFGEVAYFDLTVEASALLKGGVR